MTSLQTINTAVLNFAVEQLRKGDTLSLRTLGFSRESINRIRAINLGDLHSLAEAPGHILNIRVDNRALELFLKRIETENKKTRLLENLVKADAPFALMHHYFGMQRREYIDIRDAFGMNDPKLGRTSLPSEEEERVIAAAWHRITHDEQQPSAIDFIRVHQETRQPIRVIWALFQNWTTSKTLGGQP